MRGLGVGQSNRGVVKDAIALPHLFTSVGIALMRSQLAAGLRLSQERKAVGVDQRLLNRKRIDGDDRGRLFFGLSRYDPIRITKESPFAPTNSSCLSLLRVGFGRNGGFRLARQADDRRRLPGLDGYRRSRRRV